MGVALLTGAVLARTRRFRLHAWCQSAIVLQNLVVIVLLMVPSIVLDSPSVCRDFHDVRGSFGDRSWLRMGIRGGEDFSQRGSAETKSDPARRPCFLIGIGRRRAETVCAGHATVAANRAKQIVPCGIIKGAGQASVACLGSDGLMRFSTALNKAFENHDCIAAIRLERIKYRLYESSQCLLQSRRERRKEVIAELSTAIDTLPRTFP
jgi:hypothetical protein